MHSCLFCVCYFKVCTKHHVQFIIIQTNKYICCAFVGLGNNILYTMYGTYINTLRYIAESQQQNFVQQFSYSYFVYLKCVGVC